MPDAVTPDALTPDAAKPDATKPGTTKPGAALPDAAGLFTRFDYAAYGRLLDLLGSDRRNVRCRDLRDEPWPDRFYLLRHDVDFCPAAAECMAEFEHERGVRATYFLLLSGRHYNLLSPEHCRLPARLAALGHEVGLHYDVAALEPPERALAAQADLLALLAGTEVVSIAMHNPSVSGEDPFTGFAGFLNAYDHRFTREIGYFSDSCGAWRDEAVARLTGVAPPARLQLLIHPFFWGERHADRWERLREFAREQARAISEREAATRAAWANHTGVREHEARRA
jgi:hypothetical protein